MIILLKYGNIYKIYIRDYEKSFALVRTFNQHKNFVMQLSINPRDLSKFASASMDKTIKIWSITL